MLEPIIQQHLDTIRDPKDRDLVGAALHDIFMELMLSSAESDLEDAKKAAQQEVLAKAVRAVKQYAQKPRTTVHKPIRAMTAPPPPKA